MTASVLRVMFGGDAMLRDGIRTRCRGRAITKKPGLFTRAILSRSTRRRRRDQRGSTDEPIRNSSTARAAWRPSRIAHTTSDWPRRMSPAVNTFGTDVW